MFRTKVCAATNRASLKLVRSTIENKSPDLQSAPVRIETRIGNSSSETNPAVTAESAPVGETSATDTKMMKTDASGRSYVKGSRGGCYYLNEAGKKVYVSDKGLCGN